MRGPEGGKLTSKNIPRVPLFVNWPRFSSLVEPYNRRALLFRCYSYIYERARCAVKAFYFGLRSCLA